MGAASDCSADLWANTGFKFDVEPDMTGAIGASPMIARRPPCFVAGTRINTDHGHLPVEALEVGMCVLTRDHGFQPLRWLGHARQCAKGPDAPVILAAGAMGDHGDCEVSQGQRILVTSPLAKLLFGAGEVLVAARNLVNGDNITLRADGRPVHYVTLLLDHHEIVCGNGVDCESFHPGRDTLAGFDRATRADILGVMPARDAMMGYGYGPTVRLVLNGGEFRAICRAAPQRLPASAA